MVFTEGTLSINFDAHIKKPFKRFLEILGFDKVDEYDDLVCLREKPQGNEIQNAFACLQFHVFFEDYINSFFGKFILINHPIKIINPQIKNKKLDPK